MPNAERNTRSNTTVETLDTIGIVDILEGVTNGHLLGAVGILLLALHLNADNLNGLVPGAETTTKSTGKDLLTSTELLAFPLSGDRANPAFGKTTETETATPVGHLTNGDGIDTLVDATDTLGAVDASKGLEGGLRLDARSGELVLGDLDRLHAGAETHGGVGLGNTTGDTTEDTTSELGGASLAGVVFGLGSDEEEDSALGGGFDPCPGDKTLVD